MAEDDPPESLALIEWEPDEERAARIVADDRRLEELLIMHAVIADTLVTYQRPLVTDVERRLLVSQPPGVSAEDARAQLILKTQDCAATRKEWQIIRDHGESYRKSALKNL